MTREDRPRFPRYAISWTTGVALEELQDKHWYGDKGMAFGNVLLSCICPRNQSMTCIYHIHPVKIHPIQFNLSNIHRQLIEDIVLIYTAYTQLMTDHPVRTNETVCIVPDRYTPMPAIPARRVSLKALPHRKSWVSQTGGRVL